MRETLGICYDYREVNSYDAYDGGDDRRHPQTQAEKINQRQTTIPTMALTVFDNWPILSLTRLTDLFVLGRLEKDQVIVLLHHEAGRPTTKIAYKKS